MKNARKLIPAVAMLLVAAVMLSSSSFAWFTMSKEVAAQGMKVNIVAPTNLVISNTAAGPFANKATADKTPTKTLKPVSTVSGANDSFYAINDNQVLTDGFKSTTTSKFTAVGEGDVGGYYADFDFWISTQYTNTADLQIYIKANGFDGTETTGFTASTAEGQRLKSMRFAILNSEGDPITNSVYANGDVNQTVNEEKNQAIASLVADEGDTKDTKVMGDVNELTVGTAPSGTVVATIPQSAVGSTSAQKITIRVWCEGESANCSADTIANVQDVTLNVVFGY